MKHQIDEKGKVFTDYVTKVPVEVIVQTTTNRIFGRFHVCKDTRMKDELNDQETFLAITQAVIFDRSGDVEEYRTAFLALHRDSIVWLIQQDEIQQHGQASLEE